MIEIYFCTKCEKPFTLEAIEKTHYKNGEIDVFKESNIFCLDCPECGETLTIDSEENLEQQADGTWKLF